MQIDITVNVNVPGFYLVLGNGHLSFGTRKDNRSLGDIVKPDCTKPSFFNNEIKLNQDVHISILYGLHFLQIMIDGEARYFSHKEKYMRADEFSEMNKTGFEIKVASDKLAKLLIKEIAITEYDDDPAMIPYENTIVPTNPNNSKGVKADFSECISCLSGDIQEELLKTDVLLLSANELKIKRKIEGDQYGCKITYVSSLGVSYSLLIADTLLNHFFWWYMVANYKYENKFMGRKNDLTAETLRYIDRESPETAARIFSYYEQCCGCTKGCCAKTTYEFHSRKKTTCHGKVQMNMDLQTFSDLRYLINVIKILVKLGK